MYESILKIPVFTFFPDITYKTLLRKGFVFFYLINKGFCPIHDFVSCNKLDRIRRKNFGGKVA